MIANLPTAVNGAPEWWLWRWVARALGQLLACLAHRHTGLVAGWLATIPRTEDRRRGVPGRVMAGLALSGAGWLSGRAPAPRADQDGRRVEECRVSGAGQVALYVRRGDQPGCDQAIS
jgi:hypothetical protein